MNEKRKVEISVATFWEMMRCCDNDLHEAMNVLIMVNDLMSDALHKSIEHNKKLVQDLQESIMQVQTKGSIQ